MTDLLMWLTVFGAVLIFGWMALYAFIFLAFFPIAMLVSLEDLFRGRPPGSSLDDPSAEPDPQHSLNPLTRRRR